MLSFLCAREVEEQRKSLDVGLSRAAAADSRCSEVGGRSTLYVRRCDVAELPILRLRVVVATYVHGKNDIVRTRHKPEDERQGPLT